MTTTTPRIDDIVVRLGDHFPNGEAFDEVLALTRQLEVTISQIRALANQWNTDATEAGFAGSEPAWEVLAILDGDPTTDTTTQEGKDNAS